MEDPVHLNFVLALALMLASVDIAAWNGGKCRVEITPLGGKCRNSIFCQGDNSVCDQDSGKCKIKVGGPCDAGDDQCVERATCEGSVCKIKVGGPCDAGDDQCVERAICEGSVCKIKMGGTCDADNDQCVEGAICDWSACKIKVGGLCVAGDDQCVERATCDGSVCKIKLEGTCDADDDQCVERATCDGSVCKIRFGNSCNTTEQCVASASCVENKCECGRHLTRPEAVITTTNYPNNYTAYEHCVWIITAPEDYVIKLTFLDFAVEQSSRGPDPLNYGYCPYDYLKLFNGTEADTPEFLMICGQGNQEPIVSPGNVLRMVFHTDFSIQLRGFKIRYNFLPQDDAPDGLQ